MNETKVKDLVCSWLAERGYIATREFPVEGGRLDYLGARWDDDGDEIDIVGVECKGEATPGEVWRVANEQLYRYATCLPRQYFACSVSSQVAAQQFQALCQIAGVGFIACFDGPSEGAVLVGKEPAIGLRIEPGAYLTQVRGPVVAFDTFGRLYGDPVRRARDFMAWPYDIAAVQWNTFWEPAHEYIRLGVNLENARRALAGCDLSALLVALAALPTEARMRVSAKRTAPGGVASTVPLIESAAADLSAGDLAFIRKRALARATYLNVSLPLWGVRDARRRQWHDERMAEVRGVLAPLHSLLAVSAGPATPAAQ